jgi:hypothetical protein
MGTLAALRACAADHLAAYTDPAGPYAFCAYDRQGDPARLDPIDMLAPALLDAPVRGRHAIAMFGASGAYRDLRHRLQAVLDHPAGGTSEFATVDLADPAGPWAPVAAALSASDTTADIKASKVTKILHRKRPDLVPIFDRREADYYGTGRQTPSKYWPIFQADIVANHAWLAALAATVTTPDHRPLSIIRAADIIIWTHTEGCQVVAGTTVAPAAGQGAVDTGGDGGALVSRLPTRRRQL